jgi:hypothetical protein
MFRIGLRIIRWILMEFGLKMRKIIGDYFLLYNYLYG